MVKYEEFESAIGLNWYEIDPNLQQLMRRLLEPEDFEWCEPELRRIGALIGGPIAARAEVTDKNPPQLVKFDRHGERIDEIVHHPDAIATKRDIWESGIAGPRLRREAARRGRRYPEAMATALNFMLSQAETGMLCATGMTSGVFALVRRFAAPEVREQLLARLSAERFEDAWDGAMFMTERTGGSDLSTLTTSARWDGTRWLLNGSKWFCSNIDAGLIATLARPEGSQPGLRGLALFLVPRWRGDGTRNGIHVRRLKDKLGTRAVPTAEADFVDAEAYLLAGGESSDAQNARDGRGINRMMEMVNTSRHGVAVMGLGIMRRAFLESAIFAAHRTAFGRRLEELPMMRQTLVDMVVELEAAAALVFAACGEGALARVLVPLAKLRATRGGLNFASQAIEVHGGNGYIEDWPLARQLRDAQCHTIWEGTENIICLDVLRSLSDEQVLGSVLSALAAPTGQGDALFDRARTHLSRALAEIREALMFLARSGREIAQLRARAFAHYMADAVGAALLIKEAEWELERSGDARKALVAQIFVNSHLVNSPMRGVCSNDRVVLDLFEPLTRYGDISPAKAQRFLAQQP